MNLIKEALTFDDVLLIPSKSAVLPREVDVSTYLTPEIKLNIPFISAAMDTVTESAMAIAIAREGGIGILHKNMSIEAQCEEVDKVKRSESGMIRDPITLHPENTIGDALNIMKKYSVSGIPIIDENHKLVGIITNRDLRFEPNRKLKVKELMTSVNLITAPQGTTLERAEKILEKYKIEKLPVVDSNGMIKDIRRKFRYEQLIAGNIGTYEASLDLLNCKVDGIKVGVGPGSICTTRVIAGIGVPQVTGISEVYRAAKKKGIPIIADGGIKQTGDVPKAIAAGADSVMIGGLFAGVDESPGEKVLFEGRSFKIYRGMGSISAMKKGSKDRYFQDAEDDISKLVPEGIEGRVPFKGPLSDTIYQLIGGLRAAMGYCGVRDIKHLKTKTKFVKITLAGLKESHPHDVIITTEPPNYYTPKV